MLGLLLTDQVLRLHHGDEQKALGQSALKRLKLLEPLGWGQRVNLEQVYALSWQVLIEDVFSVVFGLMDCRSEHFVFGGVFCVGKLVN